MVVVAMQNINHLMTDQAKLFTLCSKNTEIEEKRKALGAFNYGFVSPFELGQVQFKKITYPGGYIYEGDVK